MGVGDDGLAARGLQDDESCEIDANSLWELVRCGEQACLRWGAKRPQKAGDCCAVSGSKLPRHNRRAPTGYMRNTPKRLGSMGAFSAADKARASTSRVCSGSITPSSHKRALE